MRGKTTKIATNRPGSKTAIESARKIMIRRRDGLRRIGEWSLNRRFGDLA